MTTINRPCDKTVCFRPVARVEKHFALKDDKDSQEPDEDCQRNFEPACQLLHFGVNKSSVERDANRRAPSSARVRLSGGLGVTLSC